MPRQNRVDPFGRLIATDARGTLFGNRGCLHDDRQQIVRNHSSERRWISCLTEFKGRRRELMQPGRYTELFFLDEATALAAGHRPCAECRRERFNEFRAAWAVGQGVDPASVRVGPLDRVLHAERLDDDGGKRTYGARLGDLPDGTMVSLEPDSAHLLRDDALHPWGPGGYGPAEPADPGRQVDVLTPRSIVAALLNGYGLESGPEPR